MQIIFWSGTKSLGRAQYLNKFWSDTKNNFIYWMQIIFLSGTKCLWLPQYVNKFLVWHKQFGPAQNILGPVKGQGMKELSHSLENVWIWRTKTYRTSQIEMQPTSWQYPSIKIRIITILQECTRLEHIDGFVRFCLEIM